MASPLVSPKVYARKFGDEVILLDFGRGEYFGLDAVGAAIWDGLEAGQGLELIAARISNEFACAKEQALADMMTLLDELESRSLIIR